MNPLPDIALGLPYSLSEYLQDITEALAATGTQREVIEIVLTPAVKALGAIAGVVLLIDELDQRLVIAGSQGHEAGAQTIWQDGPVDNQVPAADVLRTRQALYFEHAGELKAAYPELEERTGAVTAVATAVLPLFLDGRPLGSLVLDFREPHIFSSEERAFLRTLAAQCSVALDRAGSLRLMSQQLEERTRKLLDDNRTHEAFVAFTEAVGSEVDLLTLVRQAITVLQGHFPDASVAYYEEDGLWKARALSDDMSPELAAVLSAGLPAETPMIAQVLQTRQPVFTDAWNAQQEQVDLSEEYGAAACYPLMMKGELHRLLAVALRSTRSWSEADRGLMRAVGCGLNLALKRTQTAQQLMKTTHQLMLQNAELQARTRALEAFADLTRDLALITDPLLLIKRAQEVVMSMLADGSALYFVLESDRWFSRVQHGSLHSPELQATVDAGLLYAETNSLVIPWTSGLAYFQDIYDQNTDQLASLVGHIRATATLPLRVGGKPIGVLVFALFHQRTWTSVDRVLLETAVQSLELALDRAVKTRMLEEERAALEAFTRFTHQAGSETDVTLLVRHAITLLEETRSVDVTYLEREGDVFRVRSWSAAFPADLLARSQQGYSLDQPSFARANSERQAIFEDHWDAVQRGVPEGVVYRVLAIQPFFVDGEMISMLIMGSRTLRCWSERDKGIFRAVGQSLDLALDRTRQTRTVTAQRDALDVRTQDLATANAELEAFSYSVSHDLRTPVRHIAGFLKLARQALDGRLDEKSARYLDVVDQASERLNGLIDALLHLSRTSRQPLRLMPVDLNKMVAQIERTLLPDLLERQIRWEVARLPVVTADRDALYGVMTQLIENAVKFTRGRDPAVIKVWAEDLGTAWRMSVQDNGVGFNPQYKDRLFNLFQQLHGAAFDGTGVGLASVRRAVQKHGGQVFAEGQVGEGATFGFTLPKGTDPATRDVTQAVHGVTAPIETDDQDALWPQSPEETR